MILEAKTKNLNKIAFLHKKVLHNTFNSKVGLDFIKKLYKILIENPSEAKVWVLVEKGEVVGFISCCKNLNSISTIIEQNMDLTDKFNIVTTLLKHPSEIITLARKVFLEKYIYNHFKNYPSILTIGISPQHQRQGLGLKLIQKADDYFRKYSYVYFVDTLKTNTNAVEFYKKSEFKEYKTIYGNILFKKIFH